MARSVSDIEYQALVELSVWEEVDNIICPTQPTQSDSEEQEIFGSQDHCYRWFTSGIVGKLPIN